MSGDTTYTQVREDELPPEVEIEGELDTALLTDAEREELGKQDNAADRRRVRHKAKQRKARIETREIVLNTLLVNEAGRQFLAWLICDLCGVFGSSVNQTLQVEFLHHREGQRAIGLVLQQECLRAEPNQYMVAIRDHLTQGLDK